MCRPRAQRGLGEGGGGAGVSSAARVPRPHGRWAPRAAPSGNGTAGEEVRAAARGGARRGTRGASRRLSRRLCGLEARGQLVPSGAERRFLESLGRARRRRPLPAEGPSCPQPRGRRSQPSASRPSFPVASCSALFPFRLEGAAGLLPGVGGGGHYVPRRAALASGAPRVDLWPRGGLESAAGASSG